MIKRIVAFGCSNTFGEAMPDVWNYKKNEPTYDTPSKYAWPQIIANELNLDCKNLAAPGQSNKFITSRVLETEYQEGDIVVFLWTYFSRTCIFRNNEMPKRLNVQDIYNKNLPQKHRKYCIQYFTNYYTDINSTFESYMCINLAKYHLDSLGIPNFHYTCDVLQDDVLEHFKNDDFKGKPSLIPYPKWSAVNLPDIRLPKLDESLDNMHPGIKTMKKFANDVIEHSKLRELIL